MARTTKTRDAFPAVPGLSKAWGHCQTTDSLRTYVAAVEATANEGGYRARVLPNGVLWLAVVAHGTETASHMAAVVLDAAHAAGRVAFVDDSQPGARLVVA